MVALAIHSRQKPLQSIIQKVVRRNVRLSVSRRALNYTVMDELLNKKLELINSFLSKSSNADFSLLGITGGKILFYSYLHRAKNDNRYLIYAKQLLNDYIKDAHLKIHSISYADGLVGLASLIRHLQLNDFINSSYTISDDVIKCIYNYIIDTIPNHNDDFFYGVGGALYLLLQDCLYDKNSKAWKLLPNVISTLKQKGRPLFRNKDAELHNIQAGIPHGYASWIILICKIYSLGIEKEKCLDILSNLTSYYIPYIYDSHNGDSFFPQTLKSNNEQTSIHSRLGWCNGDIPCLYALLTYSEVIGNEQIREMVIKLLIDVSKRRELERYSVCDAGLCHGSAGIMYIFYKLYKKYKVKEFWESFIFWKQVTLSLGNSLENPTGYMKVSYDGTQVIYKTSETFIEGIAGVGLSIIAILYGIDSWDDFLLL